MKIAAWMNGCWVHGTAPLQLRWTQAYISVRDGVWVFDNARINAAENIYTTVHGAQPRDENHS